MVFIINIETIFSLAVRTKPFKTSQIKEIFYRHTVISGTNRIV